MSTIIGNPIYSNAGGGGGGSTTLDQFSYTGSFQWKDEDHTVLALMSSGVLSFPGNITLQVFLVGGGGGGATGYYCGGGGGGYTQTSQILVEGGIEYPVVIGTGGAAGTAGGNTQAFGLSVNGGQPGVAYRSYVAPTGGAGGSGAGGGGGHEFRTTDPNLYGGTGGSDGSNGSAGANWGNAGVAIGGAGQGTTTRAFGEPEGELYAGGGGGGSGAASLEDSHENDYSIYNYPGEGGAGGGGKGGYSTGRTDTGLTNYPAQAGAAGYGGGGGGGYAVIQTGGAGGSGVVLIRAAKA